MTSYTSGIRSNASRRSSGATAITFPAPAAAAARSPETASSKTMQFFGSSRASRRPAGRSPAPASRGWCRRRKRAFQRRTTAPGGSSRYKNPRCPCGKRSRSSGGSRARGARPEAPPRPARGGSAPRPPGRAAGRSSPFPRRIRRPAARSEPSRARCCMVKSLLRPCTHSRNSPSEISFPNASRAKSRHARSCCSPSKKSVPLKSKMTPIMISVPPRPGNSTFRRPFVMFSSSIMLSAEKFQRFVTISGRKGRNPEEKGGAAAPPFSIRYFFRRAARRQPEGRRQPEHRQVAREQLPPADQRHPAKLPQRQAASRNAKSRGSAAGGAAPGAPPRGARRASRQPP